MKNKGKKKVNKVTQEETKKKRRNSLTDSPLTSSGSDNSDSSPTTPDRSKKAGTSRADFQKNFARQINGLNLKNENNPANEEVMRNKSEPTKGWDSEKRKLEISIAGGDYDQFLKVLNGMCLMLQNEEGVGPAGSNGLMRKIVPRMCLAIYNPDCDGSIFFKFCDYTCETAENSQKKHAYCRMAVLIRDNVSPEFLRDMLYSVDKGGMNLLHYAVMKNNFCLAAMFLSFGFNPNFRDAQQNTAMYHAFYNNKPTMVNVLSWFGAHFNNPGSNIKIVRENDARVWARKRKTKMTAIFKEFADLATKHQLKLYSATQLSELTTFKLSSNMDHLISSSRGKSICSVELDINYSACRENYPIILMIPFAYEPQHADNAADHCFLNRLDLTDANNEPRKLLITSPVLSNGQWHVELKSAFMENGEIDHNGFFYAFELPKPKELNWSIQGPFNIAFNFNLGIFSLDENERIRFMLQAYDVNTATDGKKHTLNGKKHD